jgi:hypothetical protein
MVGGNLRSDGCQHVKRSPATPFRQSIQERRLSSVYTEQEDLLREQATYAAFDSNRSAAWQGCR